MSYFLEVIGALVIAMAVAYTPVGILRAKIAVDCEKKDDEDCCWILPDVVFYCGKHEETKLEKWLQSLFVLAVTTLLITL